MREAILKGIYSEHDDLVSPTSFNLLSTLDKGKYIVRQYVGLIQVLSPFINVHTLIRAGHIPDGKTYLEEVCENNPIILDLAKRLDDLYKYWFNTCDKNAPENKKINAILHWLRGETILTPDIKYSDIIFILSNNESQDEKYVLPRCGECFISADRNTLLATFFIMSKYISYVGSGDNFKSFDSIVSTYGAEVKNSIKIPNGIFPVPLLMKKYEDNIVILNMGSIYTSEFSISMIDIFENDKSIFEIALLNTVWLKEQFNVILGVISSFNLGIDNSNGNTSMESAILYTSRYFYGVKDYFIQSKGSKYSSLKRTVEQLVHKYCLNIDNYMDYTFTEDIVINNQTEPEFSISEESLNVLRKTQKILSTFKMEDDTAEEDTEEKPTEEDTGDDQDVDENEDTSDSDEEENTDEEEDFGSDLDNDENEDTDSFGDDTASSEPPKNKNANTSSLRGVKIELDFNPNLDSVLFKKELSVWINNLLNDEKLSEDQKIILRNIKSQWIGLLCVNTLIDWIERSLNRTIIKSN